ncbi:MAG: threonine--tRNA ligase, partial [Clostridia bacterium]|nr:threonine--tRNA ligase [Clostridia bacterium]
ERFIGILIEHFKGQFPLWLSPVQVAVVPIRPEHNDYAKNIADLLFDSDIRFEVDYSDQNMKNKIKRFKLERVPYVLVVGDKEAENETVAVNIRGQKDNKFGVPLQAFLDSVNAQKKAYTLDLGTEF